METIIPYLTRLELHAIRLLAEDKSYETVKRECGLSTLQLCSFLATIRKKTGIENTKDAQECRAYLDNVAKAPGPSPQEKEVMQRFFGSGIIQHSAQASARYMRIKEEVVHALYASGLRACGIFTKDPREARMQGMAYLAAEQAAEGAKLLTDNHRMVLHCYAQNLNLRQICASLGNTFPESYVKLLISQGLDRLKIKSRGRGVQQRLASVALARIAQMEAEAQESPVILPAPEPQKPADPMDDPMF